MRLNERNQTMWNLNIRNQIMQQVWIVYFYFSKQFEVQTIMHLDKRNQTI